jgi:two-component system, cell cycle sensor histidine kinase and response regulator CckA
MSKLAPWRWPLRFSIPAVLAVMSILLTAFGVYDAWHDTNVTIEQDISNQLIATGTRIAAVMEDRFSRNETSIALTAVQRMVTEPYLASAALVDAGGAVLTSTDLSAIGEPVGRFGAPSDAAPHIAAAIESMMAQYIWSSDRTRLTGFFPLTTKHAANSLRPIERGVLLVELDLSEPKRINLAQQVERAWIMGTVIVLSLALVWFYIGAVFNRRLTRIGDAIEATATGASGAAHIAEVDELGRFGKTIERMFVELHARGQALAASEAKYRTVVQAMAEAVVVVDHEGRLVTANEGAARTLGVAQAELTQRTLFDARWRIEDAEGRPMSPEDFPTTKTLRTREPQHNVVARVRQPNGERRWVVVNCLPIWLDEAHDKCAVLTTSMDITESREMEIAARRDRERLAAIVESAMDGVICADGDGRIAVFNSAAERIFGYDAAQILGRPLDGLLPDRYRRAHPGFVKTFAAVGTTKRSMGMPGEVVGLRANGEEFPIEASISRVNLGADVVLTVIVRDMSEHKRAQAQREQLEAQLRQSQKLQSLGTLTGGIAHDFNNILTAISGNAKLAIADLPESHPVQRSLAEISKSAARATDLVRQVLAFGRRQEPHRIVSDVAAIVGDALRFLRAMIPTTIEIRTHFARDLPKIAIDPTQLHQVITNLGSNAAHAIGDRPGAIDVTLEETILTADDARALGDIRAGRVVRLTFADDGSGIEPAILERIFEPFFTTKELGQGTGLGLSVVHGIVKSHDGAIAVHSQRGVGTRFELYFPVSAQLETAAEFSTSPSSASEVATGKTVIYLDDEEALVFLVTRILQRRGYQVLGFTEPRKALDKLAADPARIDVFISDLAMPGMSGFDVVRRLQTIRPDLPVVLVSGFLRPQDIETAEGLGVRRFLLKPDTVDALAQALDEVLAAEASSRKPEISSEATSY